MSSWSTGAGLKLNGGERPLSHVLTHEVGSTTHGVMHDFRNVELTASGRCLQAVDLNLEVCQFPIGAAQAGGLEWGIPASSIDLKSRPNPLLKASSGTGSQVPAAISAWFTHTSD
jgi:hypothetical protein